jgi:hypothetical protein
LKLSSTLSVAAVAGAALGLLWWLAYVPQVYSPVLLIAAHAAAMLLGHAALGLLGERWRHPLVVVGGAVSGGLMAPAAMGSLHAAGWLGGVSGGVIDLLVIGSAWFLGSLAGSWLSGAKRAQGAVLASGVILSMLIAFGLGFKYTPLDTVQAPTAQAADQPAPTMPVLIFGIDGADWQVLEPMMSRGELPTLTSLVDQGRRGVLRSAEPMASPVVWNTIFSGVTPSTHGLEDWYRSDARSRKVPLLWDIYAATGAETLAVNVPGTWPPNPVPNGLMVSGFPIPGLSSGDTGQLRGTLVSSTPHPAEIPLVSAFPAALDGDAVGFRSTVPIGTDIITRRIPGVSHVLIDTAGREGLISVRSHTLDLQIQPGATATISGNFQGSFALAPGEWSPWFKVNSPGLDAYVRVHCLKVTEESVELFISPSFQDPGTPRETYASLPLGEAIVGGDVPYIVEPIGWTAHREPTIAHLVPELLLQAQERQIQLTEKWLEQTSPMLVAQVFTATDRIQHPYWSLHEPESYQGIWAPSENIADQDYVEDAYRAADAALARVIAAHTQASGPPMVMVVSDHGVYWNDPKHKPELGEAGHRDAGIWIASGPNVSFSEEMQELRVVDVVPTVADCMGLAQAEDWEGEPGGICDVGTPSTVVTYIDRAGSGGVSVGESSQDQLKALGSIDE